MSRDDWEIVQRLTIAQERTREAYENTFKGTSRTRGHVLAGGGSPFVVGEFEQIVDDAK